MRRYLALAVMLISVFAAEPVQARHRHFGSWSGMSFGVGPGIGYGWNSGYWPGAYRGFYGGFYDSPLCYGPYDPYGIYYRPYDGFSSYYLPPVFAPAELLYGPRAVQQFWGLSNQPLVIRRSDRVAAAEPKVRIANPEYRRKAEQFLAHGDRLFREQKYSQALDRYKQAGAMARDLAEAQWRKGHAYVAVHRYELAAASFKRALTLDPDVARDGFDLARLYGPGALVKTSHLEALAGEALVRSDSPDYYFLLGIFLRYDGQTERAEKFFVRAAELAGRDSVHLASFLPAADEVPVAARELET
ncbi:MAG TPA: tetratricopeptide repeat protein [Pirellulaceae bacterium]|nr:tetratricopeptide repeat protein [Pirellulaceae bacterium]